MAAPGIHPIVERTDLISDENMACVTMAWTQRQKERKVARQARDETAVRCEHILLQHPERTELPNLPTLQRRAHHRRGTGGGSPTPCPVKPLRRTRGRHVKHAELPLPPRRRRQLARHASSTPAHTLHTRPSRGHAHAPGARRHHHHHHHHVVRVTRDAASAADGSAWKWAGSIMARTYARHGTGRGETHLDFPHGFQVPFHHQMRLAAANCCVESDPAASRHGTHLSTPAGGRAGRRRCRRAFHPLVGAVRRRSRSRNGPRFAVPTCGGGRRASLLRNRSKWWTLVEPD
jgi:hypothetical protein